MNEPVLSVVVPVFNEELIVELTYRTLKSHLESLRLSYEVICVDNGSTDRTPQLLGQLCEQDSRWKYVRLSRNWGYQSSITAGMTFAVGQAIVIIDADLQDPPELIAQFIEHWRDGYEIVYGSRDVRTGESWLRIGPTMLALRLIRWLSDEVDLPTHAGDFRLISRRVRDEYLRLPETTRYVRGMIHWLGYRQKAISYTRRGRIGGTSKVNWLYLLDFTSNAIFSTSRKPVRGFTLLAVFLLTLCPAVLYFSPTVVTTLLMLNLICMTLGIGILGEYLVRIYAETKRRPIYLVEYTRNIENPTYTQAA